MTTKNTRLIGESKALRDVMKAITIFSPRTEPVLITGETGTGKELVAKELHERSSRASGPFIALNCTTIPAQLLESELFGHKRGAFTGAFQDQTGKIVAANGGTLFLDEVGDMPLEVQAKLLRVLQEREVTPLGFMKSLKVDIRVVSATNKDIQKGVQCGRFRSDLYYRIRVLTVHLPPLRDRKLDILPIARAILRKQRGAPSLTRDAQEALLFYAWPGNVRELENVLLSACAWSRQTIKLSALPNDIQDAYQPAMPRLDRIVDAVTRMAMPTLGPLSEQLGIPRSTLNRLLTELVSDGTLDRVDRRYRVPCTPCLKPRQELALEHLRRAGRISRQELMVIDGCSERTASRDLAELVGLGLIEPDGRKGKAAGYNLARKTGAGS